MRDQDRLAVRIFRSQLLLLFIPFLFASLAFAAPVGPATGAVPATAGAFSSNVTVRAGEVDAVVTDKDGNPVHGLHPSDFRVLLDGVPVPVDLFEEVGAERAGAGTGPASTSSEPGSLAAPGGVVRAPRDFLIFIDEAFLVPALSKPLLRRLSAELGSLAPGDRVAVVAFDGNKLDTLTGWTSSTRRIRAALHEAEKRRAHGIAWIAFVSQVSSSYLSVGFLADPAQVGRYVTAITHSVLAAASAMRRFDPGSGKKILLLVTGGWPENPREYLLGARGYPVAAHSPVPETSGIQITSLGSPGTPRGLSEMAQSPQGLLSLQGFELPRPVFSAPDGTFKGRNLFRPMTDTANLLGYAIYGANRAPGSTAATSAEAGSEEAADSARSLAADRMYNMEESLQFAAHATGGRALFYGSAGASLERAARDFSTYYRLGFELPSEDHAVRHVVKVKVLRRGLSVRSRHELVQAPAEESPRLALTDALTVGAPLRNRGVKLETGKAKTIGRGERQMTLTIKVPWSLLELVPAAKGKGYSARFKLALLAENENGGKSDLVRLPIQSKLSKRPPAGSAMIYHTAVDLRRGRQRIAVAAYDPKVGEVGVAVASLNLK